MNLDKLWETVTTRLASTATPPLWAKDEIEEYLSEAEYEACERAHLLIDSADPMCSVDFTAGTEFIDIDPRIIYPKRLTVVGQNRPVRVITIEQMDAEVENWEATTGREIELFIFGMQTNSLRPYPLPTLDGTLNMTVIRLPLAPLTESRIPEINEKYHVKLVPWAIYRALQKHDPDNPKMGKAKDYLDEFVAEFGHKQSSSTMAEAATMFAARHFSARR